MTPAAKHACVTSNNISLDATIIYPKAFDDVN